MSPEDPTHLVVGRVRKPHGIHGEIFIDSLTDHPEAVFTPGVELSVAGERGQEPDHDFPRIRIAEVRPFRKGYLIRIGGVRDRTEASLLRGRYLLQAVERLPDLAEGELFYHQLIGMEVETVGGRHVGRVVRIYDFEPSEMLEVRTPTGTVLVPYVRSIVTEVLAEEKRIVIDPPEGLLEL